MPLFKVQCWGPHFGTHHFTYMTCFAPSNDDEIAMFADDLSILQKAIRNNDTKFLEKTFSSTREIRKIIEKLGQAGSFDPTETGKK